MHHPRFILITGCSGGGKSTLLEELRRRGHSVVEEPGRRIVRDQLATGGTALPWRDEAAFLRLAIEMAISDRESLETSTDDWVFFDRGLIDAASAFEEVSGLDTLKSINALHPYHRIVFLAPPWSEIYARDAERQHGFAKTVGEYERLARQLPDLGYAVTILPKTSVAERADFVLRRLLPDLV
ncbi:MAG: ATPase [Phenylobacterium zucineum]|nr:MAG: ATPase [Phenylobacterium zucineum]